MNKRIVLIGAGSAQFGLGTMGDVFQSDTLTGSHIVLHDINPTSLARVHAMGQAYIDEHGLPFTLSATTDRAEALQGADFCIISIEIGDRFELWEQDWRIAQQYGIRQVYGENGGPGGLFHALRIIPPILEICGDIQAICPEAHVFNFSNPMTRICLTVKRKYPDLHFVGLCHEIGSLPRHLPPMLDTPWDNLEVVAGGLNHFSVVLSAIYKDTGRDAYPDIRAKAAAYFAKLPGLGETVKAIQRETGSLTATREALVRSHTADDAGSGDAERPYWPERGLFRVILEDFGYLPITTDSHFGEYIQWAWDTVEHKGILDFYLWYKKWCMGKEPQISDALVERVIPIIEAIATDAGMREEAVNVMNDGLIDNLPADLVVEVPGIIDANGVRGVPLGPLPKGIAGLMRNQVATLDLTAEAILQGSRQLALQALLVDPIVDSYRAAKETLDTMLDLQDQYLSYLK